MVDSIISDKQYGALGVEQEHFYAEYWRKKPLLIRGSLQSPELITPIRLYELASDDEVESRAICPDNEGGFDLINGPFDEFDELPAQFLLMLNGLDQFDQNCNNLLTAFSFLPRWRIDDVMVTIGHDGTSCGPHFDNYDVFLLQTSGNKLWQLDSGSHTESDLRDNSEIRLLDVFESAVELLLSPGDMLYLPPGVGHHGINQGTAITCSIGLRNPAMTEVISSLADSVYDQLPPQQTLNDPVSGLVDTVVLNHIQGKIEATLNTVSPEDWYCNYMSTPRTPELITPTGAEAAELAIKELAKGGYIRCHLATRMVPISVDGISDYFVNGERLGAHPDSLAWLDNLAATRISSVGSLVKSAVGEALLRRMLESGAVQIHSP